MTDKLNVLVSGATGQQGGAVARELLAAGHRVKAMTRSPEGEAARALAALGAEVVAGDLDDADSLRRAMSGVWGVFAVQNTWEAGVEREEEQGKRQARIAKEVGVTHYVYTSVGSAHRATGIPHFDNKWRVEEAVREQGFPSHVVLRPVFFMENFLGPFFLPAIQQGSLAVALRPATRLQMIAVADIGRFGRLAFERAGELNGEAIGLAGDELTMPEAAAVLGAAAGRKVEFTPVPIEAVRQMSEDYAIMLEWFDRVGYDADVAGLARRFGFTPATLPEWAGRQSWS